MKIGTFTSIACDPFGLEKGLDILAEAGYESVAYNLPPLNNPGIFAEEDAAIVAHYAKIREEIEKRHFVIAQTHAPAPTISEERDNHMVFEMLRKALLASAVLGAPYVIVHPNVLGVKEDGSFVHCLYDRNKESCKALNMDVFSRLIPYLEEYDTRIAIENIWIRDHSRKDYVICPTACSDPYELAEYIDTLNAMCPSGDRFVACLDVGHANITCRGISIRKVVNVLGPRLKALHVHDNDGLQDQHTAPGLGTVDWEDFCLGLRDIGYDGDFTLEDSYYRKFDTELIPAQMRFLYQIARHLCEKYDL